LIKEGRKERKKKNECEREVRRKRWNVKRKKEEEQIFLISKFF
jgi:hypothetical protein